MYPLISKKTCFIIGGVIPRHFNISIYLFDHLYYKFGATFHRLASKIGFSNGNFKIMLRNKLNNLIITTKLD